MPFRLLNGTADHKKGPTCEIGRSLPLLPALMCRNQSKMIVATDLSLTELFSENHFFAVLNDLCLFRIS